MPRKPDLKNGYPELHDGYYRVTMGVPAKLRPLLSYRLKQALGTKSLLSANVLKRPVVKAFRARIDKAWGILGDQPRSTQAEAIEWAKIVSDDTLAQDEVAKWLFFTGEHHGKGCVRAVIKRKSLQAFGTLPIL